MSRRAKLELRSGDEEMHRRRLADAANWMLTYAADEDEENYVILDSSLGPLAVGTLMGYESGWVKADNTDKDRRARLIVKGADRSGRGYRATGKRGKFRWSSHGLGTVGTKLWLGTSGGLVTSEPQGSAVFISQYIGMILDLHSILLEWDTPLLELT